MTIDEAIAHAREASSRKFNDMIHCIRCHEFHEQIAEWLEELKEYQEISKKNPFLVDMIKHDKIVRNKAIDDCKELTFREVVYYDSLNDRTEFRELAEQLKAGGKNER